MDIENLSPDEIDAILGGTEEFESSGSEYTDSDSYSDSDSDEQVSDAQQEWEESVRQLEGLLYLVLFPVAGKFIGRRLAFFCKWRVLSNCRDWSLFG